MAEAIYRSTRRLWTIPLDWHPLPLTPSTKKALMDSFSHYENFSYDEKRGNFLVEVPVPPGRGNVSRATPEVLQDHVEFDIKLTRSGNCATSQPRRPLEECYSWWLGQLVHYGLPLVLSTDEAKQAVKSAMLSGALKVPTHLKKMEQRMRNVVSRRAKSEVRRIAKKSTLNERRKNIKVESLTSGSEDIDDIIRTPASRRRSQAQSKIETDISFESESANNVNSSDAETDSDTIEKVPKPGRTMNSTRSITKNKTATVKPQQGSVRKTSSEGSSENSSSEGIDGERQDISHNPIGTEQHQDTSAIDSDSDDGDGVKPAFASAMAKNDNSDDDSADGRSFSGDSEYERAAMSHSQNIDGASARYGDTDTDSSSESSYDNEAEVQSNLQPPKKKADDSTKATHNPPKSDPCSALKFSTSKATPMSATMQPGIPKQLEIKRDRKPRPEELERASTRETTPSRTPKKRPKQDHQHTVPATTAKQVATTANAHPGMTYEDIRDPVTRHKIARMCGMFPRVTIHFCYTCLAKHNGNYDKGCEELVNATSVLTPQKPAQRRLQDAQATSYSRKRKRSSLPKQTAVQNSSPGKHQDPFALSDSDEPIVKQEPTPKRRKAFRRERPASIISDDMHGSQIDLTVLNDAEITEEVESDPPANKRGLTSGSYNKSSATYPSSPKPLRAVSVEVSSLLPAKSRIVEKAASQTAFTSSSPTEMVPKGVLKSSPSFRSRDSLLSQALNSVRPPSSKHRTQSSDLPPHPQLKNSEPELPPQPPLRKTEHKAAPHHQVGFGSYTTQSGWQALNQNSKSKMRPSGQIEEEAQPETRTTLFPQENNRIVGLSRQDGGVLLRRGIVSNPSTSNSISTKRKHREKGF